METEKIKILYAEDDEIFADQTQQVLEMSGYEVLIARNGNEALAMYQKHTPDLVLLDLDMPGRNGMEILESIKKKDPEFLVVIYSSHIQPEHVIKAMDLGVEDYISKTSDLDVFIARIDNIIQRSRQGKSLQHIFQLSPATSFDSRAEVLTINGKSLKIKPMDARLLKALTLKLNEWADTEYLSIAMWQIVKKMDELKKYVLHLRKLLKDDPSLVIENQWGGFYRLTNKPETVGQDRAR